MDAIQDCQGYKTTVTGIYWDNDGGLKSNNIQLMETLIKHILQNFVSTSYMERHAFVYMLEFDDPRYDEKTNFKSLVKESFTFNQHQKPTF